MSNQKKPDQIYPSAPTSTPSPMPNYIPDPSMRGESWDQLLKNRGIRFIHRKATPCPNMTRVYDNNHDPNCPVCDGQGIVYYEEKEIWGVFQSNSLEKTFEMQGIWEIGTAVVTLPTEYADGQQAEFNRFDQLVIPDFTTRMWELKEYEPRLNNQQQFRYPVFNVDFLGSVVNNVLKKYEEGVDFNVVDGNIEWVAGKQPTYDAANQRGEVLSVQYFANPVYNVLQHLRELRISQQLINGQKVAKRLPQQIIVKRDFLTNGPEKEASPSS